MQRVRDVLAHKGRQIYGINPDATVFDAIANMAEKEIGALLVLRAGRPVGIISERDYTRNVILKDRSSKQTRVADIMTSELVTVTSEEHIDECVTLMKRHHIRHLPVVDESQVVGVLSLRDLFDAIISEQAHTIEHLEHYVRGEV
jgi:CBS domain-containing protein